MCVIKTWATSLRDMGHSLNSIGHHLVYNHPWEVMTVIYVIVKSHYEEVIVVITRVRGGAEDECNNNDNLRVQWDLTGFYPIVFDVRHIAQ